MAPIKDVLAGICTGQNGAIPIKLKKRQWTVVNRLN